MSRLVLIHWKPAEAEGALRRLIGLGHTAKLLSEATPATLRAIRGNPPEVILIDLTRMPSHGREFGVALRTSRATRHVPLVFAGGLPEKVERVRELLPDAVFTEWDEVEGAIRRALAYSPITPVVPTHGISNPGKPLVEKLGIREGMHVALIDAPDGIDDILRDMPEGVVLAPRCSRSDGLRILFVRSAADLARRLPALSQLPSKTALWICYPKKASGVPTDLTQFAVRECGFGFGLVDDKVCSVDQIWTGFRLRRRKSAR